MRPIRITLFTVTLTALASACGPRPPTDGGTAGSGGTGGPAPPITDYAQPGPYPTTVVESTGPGGQYTLFRPATLGQNGVLHPPATWGNGIFTTPAAYMGLLPAIASYGFVVIASNSTSVNATLMRSGLDWLIQQNTAAGELRGVLDTSRAVSIGYSLGGGAAVETGSHPAVVTTVSFHGLQGAAERLHGPLLLMAGTADTVVTAAQFVTPTYNRSTVQTFYGTLSGADHLKPINTAGEERAPAIAWLRLWTMNDPGARGYFYGDDCVLCEAPWINPQRKNWR